MSTRGAVGIKTKDGFEAIYNHWDSYPTGLGQDVYRHIVNEYIKKGKSFEDFKKSLLSFTDWREYLNGGICPYCGKKGRGQPVSISGMIFGLEPENMARDEVIKELSRKNDKDSKYILESLKSTGYPDPEARFHGHTLDGRTVKETHLFQDDADPLFIEWIYVIDYSDGKWRMDIYSHFGYSKDGPVYEEEKRMEDGKFDYGHCVYWHKLVGTVDITEEMLNSKKMNAYMENLQEKVWNEEEEQEPDQ